MKDGDSHIAPEQAPSGPTPPARPRGSPAAFLLAQVGAHAAARFGELLEPLGLTPAHVGLLRVVGRSSGASQQEVAELLGMFPSRLVGLVDELQERGLIERAASPHDRRINVLLLTDAGERTLTGVGRIARAHQDRLLGALDSQERATLASLLGRIAQDQGLTPGVHPGFARMGPVTQPLSADEPQKRDSD